MVIEMYNQGLYLSIYILNYMIRIVCELGLVDYVDYVFDEMCLRGVCLDFCSYVIMVVVYCRMGKIFEVDKWLNRMIE